MMSDKTTTQIRVDNIIYGKVKHIAESELSSVNIQIEYFLKKGIELYEMEHGAIIQMDVINANLSASQE